MAVTRWSLGLVLLAMAAGQLSDLGGFAAVLGGYDIFPAWGRRPAALALALAELGAGAGLVLGSEPAAPARQAAAVAALAVAVAWAALGAQAFGRGLVLDNCGCFGVHLPQRLWWGVLVQDAAFVASAAWVLRAARRPEPRGNDLRPLSRAAGAGPG